MLNILIIERQCKFQGQCLAAAEEARWGFRGVVRTAWCAMICLEVTFQGREW